MTVEAAPSIATLAAQAETFRGLHAGPSLLVLPNAWDAASARVFAEAGFPAIATASGGVAAVLGYEDHEQAPEGLADRRTEEMLAAAARIARSVAIPVSGDIEAGYGLAPPELARRVIAAGLVGVNLEDTDYSIPRGAGLVDADRHAERLAAFKAATRALGVDVVLNARVDVFVRREGTAEEQLAEAIRRGRLYHEAGADCVYPILLLDAPTIEAFVRGVGCAVNIFYRTGTPTFQQLEEIGVRRITFATSMFRELMSSLERAAADVRVALGTRAAP